MDGTSGSYIHQFTAEKKRRRRKKKEMRQSGLTSQKGFGFEDYHLPSSVWSESCVALKHFCGLFRRLLPTFAVEAISLTGLRDSELQCYSFFVPRQSCCVSLCEGGELGITPSKRQTCFCFLFHAIPFHIILYVYATVLFLTC